MFQPLLLPSLLLRGKCIFFWFRAKVVRSGRCFLLGRLEDFMLLQLAVKFFFPFSAYALKSVEEFVERRLCHVT